MLTMKWILDQQGPLVAKWIDTQDAWKGAPDCLSEGRVFPAGRTGGPPGQSRGILALTGFKVRPVCLAFVNRLACVRAIGKDCGAVFEDSKPYRRFRRTAWAVLVALISFCLSVRAQDSANGPTSDPQPWNIHFQSTVIAQGHPSFPADYTGANSLTPDASARETISVDAMAGVRLWHGGEFFIDILMWQGYGLSNTLGMAGFPNGEAFRIGKTYPDAYICRAYLRETIELGGEEESTEDGPLELRGKRDVRRLTFTVGHLSAKDIFDSNAYANDGRAQFMNWSLIANDTWDYPADTLGFTNGAAVELNTHAWAGRLGIFMVSKVANGLRMDWNLSHAWSAAAEVERRYSPRGHAGSVRLFAYDQRAHMGNYQQTIDNPSLEQDIALNAAYRYKYGFGINVDQEIRKNLGVFARLGWSDGKNQTYEFTDVDRTAAGGISVKGARWRRPQDTVGLAVIVNGLSAVHRQYLAAGGLGITVGDGALDYTAERVVEAYYNWHISKHFQLSPDYQFAPDPAYNRARGPVNLFALRLHTEY
jgi:high affinity Mn2+ porin